MRNNSVKVFSSVQANRLWRERSAEHCTRTCGGVEILIGMGNDEAILGHSDTFFWWLSGCEGLSGKKKPYTRAKPSIGC